MMKALISDIHSNLEALCVVLKDIEQYSVEETICLGDVVGYGADPESCVDLVMQHTQVTLLGNHDYALIYAPDGFNPLAASVIRKTKELMDPSLDKVHEEFREDFYFCNHSELHKCFIMGHSKPQRWEFIQNRPSSIQERDVLFVHGSPLNPTFEYVFPEKVASLWNPERLESLFEKVNTVAFCGHTHIPCAIRDDLVCFYPDDTHCELRLEAGKKYIINTGSVGQPRDRDNRACYLLYDSATSSVRWPRIPYNYEMTIEKIEQMCGKDSWCATRLRLGK
ncbi:MAG: metallophosphoesterase family protein [Chitinivibrionales bacterium]|nr:metallophosphoesterase family protein [Chitinivibrionales bacterium]